jgi:hypothetical protein
LVSKHEYVTQYAYHLLRPVLTPNTVPKDAKKATAALKKNTALQKALEIKLGSADVCYASELLNPLPTGRLPWAKQELKSESSLPCKSSLRSELDDIQNNQIADKVWATEIRGRKCIRASIFADNYVASCFVPTKVWFDAGNDIRPLLRNDDKGKEKACFCEGEKVCSLQRSGLLPNTTYVGLHT